MNLDRWQAEEADQALRRLATLQPPEGMPQRILQRVQRAEAMRAHGTPLPRSVWGWTAAWGAAVVLAAVSGLGRMATVPPPPPSASGVARGLPHTTIDEAAGGPTAAAQLSSRFALRHGAVGALHKEQPLAATSAPRAVRRPVMPWRRESSGDPFATGQSELAGIKTGTPGEALPRFTFADTPGQSLPALASQVPGRPLPSFEIAQVPGHRLPSFANATTTGDQP